MLVEVGRNSGAGDHDDIRIGSEFVNNPCKLLTNDTLYAISRHRVSDLTRDREPETGAIDSLRASKRIEHEMPVGDRMATPVDRVEIT